MLKKEDKIFKNLYGEDDWSLTGALKRGIWNNTKDLISMGSDNIENWVKSSYKADENGNYPVSFKVDIKENTYSQMWGLDSLGNGNAEYYKRVE